MIKEIKNIIFDLGGVIIDIDPARAYTEIGNLLGNDGLIKAGGGTWNGIFLDHETGRVNSSRFVDFLRESAGKDITNDEIIYAWNSMLLGVPLSRVQMLRNLGSRYKLLVLSNTNQLHVDCFERMAPGVEVFSSLFHKVYYSHVIGYRKPDREAFLHVIEDSGVIPGHTLFVDDLAENIKSARQLGFHTLHVTKSVDVCSWFTRWDPSG